MDPCSRVYVGGDAHRAKSLRSHFASSAQTTEYARAGRGCSDLLCTLDSIKFLPSYQRTRNRLGNACVGSNPAGREHHQPHFCFSFFPSSYGSQSRNLVKSRSAPRRRFLRWEGFASRPCGRESYHRTKAAPPPPEPPLPAQLRFPQQLSFEGELPPHPSNRPGSFPPRVRRARRR